MASSQPGPYAKMPVVQGDAFAVDGSASVPHPSATDLGSEEPLSPPHPVNNSPFSPSNNDKMAAMTRVVENFQEERAFERNAAMMSSTSSSSDFLERPNAVVGGALYPGFDLACGGNGGDEGPSDLKRDEDYKKKREKNNEAVRKSRQKTKHRTMETARRVETLKQENDELEQRTKSLTKELKLLKEIFVRQMNQQSSHEGEEGN